MANTSTLTEASKPKPLTPKQAQARLAEVTEEIQAVEKKLTFILQEDRSEYAQTIIDKLFEEFKKGYAWIRRMSELAEREYYVYSPIGRIRHLYAALTGIKEVVAKQVRRGTNAPVQGFASEVGTKASRRVMLSYYRIAPKMKQLLGLGADYDHTVEFNRVVHDALYFSVPYAMVLPFIHVLQYEATYGVTQAYEEEFGLKFTIEPEIEIEVASRDDTASKWDWSTDNLMACIDDALKVSQEIGTVSTDAERSSILGLVLDPWRNLRARKFLQTRFPLLNVTELDSVMDKTLAKYDQDHRPKKARARAV